MAMNLEQSDGGKGHWYCNKEVAQASGCSTPNKLPKPEHLKQYREPTGFIGIVSGDDMIGHCYGDDMSNQTNAAVLKLPLSQVDSILPVTDDLFAEEEHPIRNKTNVTETPLQRNEVAVLHDAPLTSSDVAEETG